MIGRLSRFSLVGFIGALLQLALVSLLTKYFGVLSTAATLVAVELTILQTSSGMSTSLGAIAVPKASGTWFDGCGGFKQAMVSSLWLGTRR